MSNTDTANLVSSFKFTVDRFVLLVEQLNFYSQSDDIKSNFVSLYLGELTRTCHDRVFLNPSVAGQISIENEKIRLALGQLRRGFESVPPFIMRPQRCD